MKQRKEKGRARRRRSEAEQLLNKGPTKGRRSVGRGAIRKFSRLRASAAFIEEELYSGAAVAQPAPEGSLNERLDGRDDGPMTTDERTPISFTVGSALQVGERQVLLPDSLFLVDLSKEEGALEGTKVEIKVVVDAASSAVTEVVVAVGSQDPDPDPGPEGSRPGGMITDSTDTRIS